MAKSIGHVKSFRIITRPSRFHRFMNKKKSNPICKDLMQTGPKPAFKPHESRSTSNGGALIIIPTAFVSSRPIMMAPPQRETLRITPQNIFRKISMAFWRISHAWTGVQGAYQFQRTGGPSVSLSIARKGVKHRSYFF